MDKFFCMICKDVFTEEDLQDLRDMREAYYRDKHIFMCPDCWDDFSRMDLEEREKILLGGME